MSTSFPNKNSTKKTREWISTSFPNKKSTKKTREWISTSFPNKKSTKENKRMNFHQFSQQKLWNKKQEHELPPVFPTKNLQNKQENEFPPGFPLKTLKKKQENEFPPGFPTKTLRCSQCFPNLPPFSPLEKRWIFPQRQGTGSVTCSARPTRARQKSTAKRPGHARMAIRNGWKCGTLKGIQELLPWFINWGGTPPIVFSSDTFLWYPPNSTAVWGLLIQGWHYSSWFITRWTVSILTGWALYWMGFILADGVYTLNV